MNGCNVWVDENGFDAGFLESLEGLGAWRGISNDWSQWNWLGATASSMGAVDNGQCRPVLTRVIKFSSLANGQSTTTDNQHLLHINEILTTSNHTALQIGLRVGRDLGIAGCITDVREVQRPLGRGNRTSRSSHEPRPACRGQGASRESACGQALLALADEVLRPLSCQSRRESHWCVPKGSESARLSIEVSEGLTTGVV